MSKENLSLILTTKRGIDSLKPLFVTTDDKTELIIIDDDYNEKTKEWLSKQKGYDKIVYSPIKNSPQNHQRSFSQGLNTALLYAENKWIVRADDNLEFKPDFFDIVRENIINFEETIGHNHFAIIGQKLWGRLNHQKWNDASGLPAGSRHLEVKNPAFTFSFGIFPVECVYVLNGYDERYDCGWGFDDTNFLLRLMTLGYSTFFDREMLAYSLQHEPKRDTIPITNILYMLDSVEISNGKIRAYNPFNFQELQREFLAKKKDYII